MSTTVETRVITIYSSQGKNNNKIQFTGTLWSELKSRLKNEGYNIGSMKAIEGNRRSTLESDKAILPEGNFNLHLYPHKTKGGAKKKEKVELNRKELCSKAKAIIAANGEEAKKHFNKDKNYSNKTTEEIDALVTKWEKKHGVQTTSEASVSPASKPTKAAVTKGTAKAIAGIVTDLAVNASEEEKKEAGKHTPDMAIKTSIEILKGVSGHENQVNIEKAITELEKALIKKPTKSEEELLKEEHEEIMAGLEGIVR